MGWVEITSIEAQCQQGGMAFGQRTVDRAVQFFVIQKVLYFGNRSVIWNTERSFSTKKSI